MSDVDFKDNEAKSLSQGSRGGDTLAQIFWPSTEVRDPEIEDAQMFTAKPVEARCHQDVTLLSSLIAVGYH